MRNFIKNIVVVVLIVLSITTIIKPTDEGNIEAQEVMLVNKSSSLSKNYVPQNLIEPDIVYLNSVEGEEKLLEEEAAISIEKLFYQAKMENIKLYATSGYRSYELQKNLYKDRVKSQGKITAEKYVARPGESEHQTGLAIDITNEERYFTGDTKEAKWLENNAYKFGFIVRYPKDKEYITGYNYEPWHLRYVGVEIAKQIHEREIVLEEYLNIN
jgi:D-alanyl-D-alanine carboxypeptidase